MTDRTIGGSVLFGAERLVYLSGFCGAYVDSGCSASFVYDVDTRRRRIISKGGDKIMICFHDDNLWFTETARFHLAVTLLYKSDLMVQLTF